MFISVNMKIMAVFVFYMMSTLIIPTIQDWCRQPEFFIHSFSSGHSYNDRKEQFKTA